jgi:hypothetical protein
MDFGLTQSEIYYTRGVHANHYITNVVKSKMVLNNKQ